MSETFKRIWHFSSKRHSDMIRGLIFSFLRGIFGVTQILAIIYAVEALAGMTEINSAIIKIVILTFACIIGNFLTSYFEQKSTMSAGYLTVADKRVEIGSLLRRVPLGFFNKSSVGKITATLTTTLSGVESASVMVVVGIISGLFSAGALFIFMLIYDYRIGLVTGLGMITYLIVVNYEMRFSRKHAPKLQKAQTFLAESAVTFLQGIKVTKAFSFKDGDKNLKDAIDSSCDENINLTVKSMPTQFISGITLCIFESVILMLSLFFCFKLHDIDIVKTIVLVIFSFLVYASLNQAGSMLSMIGLLDSGLIEAQKIEETKTLETRTPLENAQSNEINFENVSFAYDENEVLHNINLNIKPNSLTAIIGPSGSGKTTLCELIPRFRDVTSGRITLGKADIRNMDYEDLMKRISMVFQNVYLFEDTVLNNIRFSKPDATLEEIRAAAKKARCDDFIMNLKDGYDTVIGEGGSSLSGGEKQRISIARAILKDSPIIILDEATSALDAENEQEILAAIDELTKNKTVIMIAHRIKTVKNADCIVALKDGRIVQMGKHEDLINKDGLYKDFILSREKAKGWQIEA